MAAEPKVYQRFTKTRRLLGGYTSLWLASDHILQANSNGLTERYQRFYFRDIKGLFIIESSRRSIIAMIVIIKAFLLAFAFGLGSHSLGVGVTVMAAYCGLFLTWNHLLGRGCKVFLATGVQTVQLEPLVRRPYANKIVPRMIELIETAQLGLKPETAPVPPPSTLPPLPTV
jgi:hypothetical protein